MLMMIFRMLHPLNLRLLTVQKKAKKRAEASHSCPQLVLQDGTDTENDESENDQTEGEPSQDNNEGSTDLLNEDTADTTEETQETDESQAQEVPVTPGAYADDFELEDGSRNWDIFYNPDTHIYEVTYIIPADAEGDQNIDLTRALDLLVSYVEAAYDAYPER